MADTTAKKITGMRSAVALLGLALVAGCGEGPAASGDAEVNQSPSAIIGGFPANASSLNAVGTLGMKTQGKYTFFCTATLVSPTVVITAKHCAASIPPIPPSDKLIDFTPIYFAIGPDSWNPLEMVEANGAWFSPETNGGLEAEGLTFGNDVAVYTLIRPVTSVKPIPVATTPLAATDIGSKFVSMGFGLNRNRTPNVPVEQQVGTRRMGAGTLRALTGLYFQHVFGTLSSLLANEVTVRGRALTPAEIATLTDVYNKSDLLPGYDSWVGNKPGDAQPCAGDSGSPLLRLVTSTVNGVPKAELRVFGVVSGGWHSKQQMCDFGTWYALIGPKTQDLVTWATGYQDPCLGTTTRGTCTGTVATRCTFEGPEGVRRKSAVDCADLLQVCAVGADLSVGCVDPAAPPALPVAAPEGGATREELFSARWGAGLR